MRRYALVLALLLLGTACQPVQGSATRTAAEPGFSFAAAGDVGANRTTARSLRLLDASDAEFFIAVGDLDYDETTSDRAWCRYVKHRLPSKAPTFPFELLVGNHEGDNGPDGRVEHFAACLPDRLDAHGQYGRQYAFSFPRSDPYATFINIAPGLRAGGHRYTYKHGTDDRRWLKRQIRHAQEAGHWVVVSAHYPCLSTGVGHPGCASGHGVHNLLLRRGVDLIVNGHNHVYERGKQLAFSASCPRIPPGEYDADCVVDDGSDGAYRRGAGTVQVTSGRMGGRPMELDRDDPDAPYFAVLDAGTTGFTAFHVTPDRLEAHYVASTGSLEDSFTISR